MFFEQPQKKETEMKSMQLFSVVGPLGAGKTTFVMNVIKALQSRGFNTKEKVAYVLNDEGVFLDGELARRSAQVVAMTNGCFTCDDTEDLRNTLIKLEQSGTEWVFLEGFGLISGSETRTFLESCPYSFHIVCLLDHKHHRANSVRYGAVMRSHVRAATLAVGITKFESDGDHLLELETVSGIIPELVASENPGLLMTVIPDSEAIPTEILDVIFKRPVRRNTFTVHQDHEPKCGCAHHHHHDHSHVAHDHVHSMYPYSLSLKETATFVNIRKAFEGKDFVLRIKGAVEGLLFNEIHGDWRQTLDDPRRFVTFYSARKVVIEADLPELAKQIDPKKTRSEDEQSYVLLRQEETSRKETVQEVEKLLREFPSEPILLPGEDGLRLITHPEGPQNLKEIARRPYVMDEWFPIVIKRFMEYWIKCAKVLEDRPESISQSQIGKNRRELGISMVWWTNRYADSFDIEMVKVIETLRPGEMAIKGVLSLENLNSDSEKARWQCDEILEAIRYGLAHAGDPVYARQAVAHCLAIANTQELKQQWERGIRSIEEIEKATA